MPDPEKDRKPYRISILIVILILFIIEFAKGGYLWV